MLRTPRGVVLGTLLTAALAVGMLQAPGQAAPSADRQHPRPAYKNSSLSTEQRVADLLSPDDAGGEDRPDDPGRAGRRRRRPVADHDVRAGQHPVRRRVDPGRPTRPRRGPTWSTATRRRRSRPGSGIPLLYGVDSVHGHGNLQGATVFPHNIGLGATRDPALVEDVEHITAIETRATGPQWAFAPCVCVARDDRWGRTYESFGEDPKLVSTHGDRDRRAPGQRRERPGQAGPRAGHRQALRRRRPDDKFDPSRRPPTPIDQGIDQVSRRGVRAARARAVRPGDQEAPRRFGHAVLLQRRLDRGRAGQPDQDAREPGADHRLAQGQQGFDGLVISDWRAIRQIPGTYTDQVATSVQRRGRHVHGADPGTEQPQRLGRLHPDPHLAGGLRRRADEPDRRRGLADPDRQVRARPLRAPVHRPPNIDTDRQQGAPQGRPPGGGRVAGAAQEPAGHPAARPGRSSRCTSPAATPTTSATRPAAGR